MRRRLTDIICVFQIQLARLRREAGPFLLASVVFPLVMYMFTSAVGAPGAGAAADPAQRMRYLSGSIVFSLSLTAISWLGYLLLENRFTGRLKLFATLPLAPSSCVTGVFCSRSPRPASGRPCCSRSRARFGMRTSVSIAGALLLRSDRRLTVLCVCGIGVIIAARARLQRRLAPDRRPGRGPRVPGADLLSARRAPAAGGTVLARAADRMAARGVQTTLLGGAGVGLDDTVGACLMATMTSPSVRVMRWQED